MSLQLLSGADLSQRLELFEDAFPENRKTPVASVEHYRWKFHSAPLEPSSYEYSAIEAARMLGYYAAIPYPYQMGERRMLAAMVCDVMTHSEARGRGLFTELGKFALGEMEETELDFALGYPIRPGVMGGHLRAGWQVAFDLPMYLKPLKADAVLSSRGVGWLGPVANLGVAIQRAVLAPRRNSTKYHGKSGAPSELIGSVAFAAFIENWSVSVKNHLIKTADFYNWRLGAPGVSYRVFLVCREEEVVAAAVARETVLHEIPSFALLDVMVLAGCEDALPTLYCDIEAEGRRLKAQAIVVMMSKRRARDYRLARFGFLRTPFTFKAIARSLGESIAVEEIAIENDWHLMWIDSDDL